MFLSIIRKLDKKLNYEEFDAGYLEDEELRNWNWKLRRYTLNFRGDHNGYQNELKYIKERFFFELITMTLQKIFCNDIANYICMFL